MSYTGNPPSTDETKKGELAFYGFLRSNAQKTETRKMKTISERLYVAPNQIHRVTILKNEVSQIFF